MTKICIIYYVLTFAFSVSAQQAVTIQSDENIPGVCDKNEIYIMFSYKGQEKAVCETSTDEILKRLNSEVPLIKDNSIESYKTLVSLIINCNGKMVQCKLSGEKHIPELDKQIKLVFNSLGSWNAAKFFDKDVDSIILYTIEIKNGEFSIK